MAALIIPFCLAAAVFAREAAKPLANESRAEGPPAAARRLKKTGDEYVLKDDYKNAADNFLKALSLSKDFSEDELIEMAVYVSWDDRLDEAIDILSSVVSKNPANVKARIHLARTLSWAGRLDKAIEEADRALLDSPGRRDALLVKANSLNWAGRQGAAIPIYKDLLKMGEGFDAGVGLANALLSNGDVEGAKETRAVLAKPQFAYQERDVKALDAAIARSGKESAPALGPALGPAGAYYSDSDHNRVGRYSFIYSFSRNGKKIELSYRHTDAGDDTRRNGSDELFIKAPLTPSISAGAGFKRLDNMDKDMFLTGLVRGVFRVYGADINAGVSHDVLVDTAPLIENGIRMTDVSANASLPAAEKLHIYGSYSQRFYSDNNRASDIVVSPYYAFMSAAPRITAGYRLRLLDFQRQSRGGYFDPDNFISHQAYVSISHETGKLYFSLEPYYGHQSFKRNNSSTNDFFKGGFALAGFRAAENLSIEVSAEGGDYAAGAASGFKYFTAGLKVIYAPQGNLSPSPPR